MLGLGLGSTNDAALTMVGLQGVGPMLADLRAIANGWHGVTAAQNTAASSGERMNAWSNKFLLAGGTIAGATLMMNVASLKAAGSNEANVKSLEALTKSASKARDIFSYIDASATESLFNRKDLMTAGRLLTAYEMDVRRFLPLSDDLAAAFADQGVKAGDVARALGRISSGDFGEAFERLRDFGISRKELEGQGLKFDRGGAYQGTVEQALDAIETIINRRFKGLSKKMATETLLGAVSNFEDAMDRLKSSAGVVILPEATKAVKAMTELVNKVNEFTKANPELTKTAFKIGGVTAAALILVSVLGKGYNFLRGISTAVKTATGKGGGLGGTNVGTMHVNAVTVFINGSIMGGGGPGGFGGGRGGGPGGGFPSSTTSGVPRLPGAGPNLPTWARPWWSVSGGGLGMAARSPGAVGLGILSGLAAHHYLAKSGALGKDAEPNTLKAIGNTGGRIGAFLTTGHSSEYDRGIQADQMEAESSQLFYGARGPNSYQAGHLRRLNQQQQAARLSSFYDSHYGDRKAETITNARATRAAPGGRPPDWDPRAAEIAALFGRGPGAGGGSGINIGMENGNDDSTTVTMKIPARRSDGDARRIRYVNNAKAPPMP